MPTPHESRLISAAKAEDTYDLMQHIAWTDVVQPALDREVRRYSEMLVANALGTPMPGGLTREQVAGMCYGIQFVSRLLEKILKDGEKALKSLQDEGISLHHT